MRGREVADDRYQAGDERALRNVADRRLLTIEKRYLRRLQHVTAVASGRGSVRHPRGITSESCAALGSLAMTV